MGGYDCGVDRFSAPRNLDMNFCETLFVFRDGVKKSKRLITWVKVVQTALIHSELNVWFYLRFYIDYEYHIFAPVGDDALET